VTSLRCIFFYVSSMWRLCEGYVEVSGSNVKVMRKLSGYLEVMCRLSEGYL